MGRWRGRGETLRVRPLAVGGMGRGARLIVRDVPAGALSISLNALQQERFDLGDDRVRRALEARNSEWIAQDVRIGHPSPTWSTGLLDAALSNTALALVPGLWRRASPTVVIASARAHPVGAEIVIFPHQAVRGWSSASDASPLITAALERIGAHYAGDLVHTNRMFSIPDDGAPASQAFVREVLDWY